MTLIITILGVLVLVGLLITTFLVFNCDLDNVAIPACVFGAITLLLVIIFAVLRLMK